MKIERTNWFGYEIEQSNRIENNSESLSRPISYTLVIYTHIKRLYKSGNKTKQKLLNVIAVHLENLQRPSQKIITWIYKKQEGIEKLQLDPSCKEPWQFRLHMVNNFIVHYFSRAFYINDLILIWFG